MPKDIPKAKSKKNDPNRIFIVLRMKPQRSDRGGRARTARVPGFGGVPVAIIFATC
jgi:hypothetical protein